jgi:hypothetical protein
MRLILITQPGALPNEAQLATKVLRAGLQTLHVRKPDWSADQVRAAHHTPWPCACEKEAARMRTGQHGDPPTSVSRIHSPQPTELRDRLPWPLSL